jgi:hypothetical protein
MAARIFGDVLYRRELVDLCMDGQSVIIPSLGDEWWLPAKPMPSFGTFPTEAAPEVLHIPGHEAIYNIICGCVQAVPQIAFLDASAMDTDDGVSSPNPSSTTGSGRAQGSAATSLSPSGVSFDKLSSTLSKKVRVKTSNCDLLVGFIHLDSELMRTAFEAEADVAPAKFREIAENERILWLGFEPNVDVNGSMPGVLGTALADFASVVLPSRSGTPLKDFAQEQAGLAYGPLLDHLRGSFTKRQLALASAISGGNFTALSSSLAHPWGEYTTMVKFANYDQSSGIFKLDGSFTSDECKQIISKSTYVTVLKMEEMRSRHGIFSKMTELIMLMLHKKQASYI